VISGTERMISDNGSNTLYSLEPISGRIIFSDPISETKRFIIFYEYLSKPFQTRIGPPIALLPHLDELPPIKRSSEKVEGLFSVDNELPMILDGTIFRGISMSPSSGVSLNGGLQLGLQGQLAENMTVTGTLSDQNIPIQPEGNTQTLDEIDKVYLEIKHPSATIVAGDLDMQMDFGQFLNISRRLEGLTVQLSGKRDDAGLTLASTKGKFFRMEINGLDRNQGPYSLLSEIGSRNIIVMAGSEQVWLDGQKLERGENSDYTIDYSRGEISFTPKRVIDSNSRIYIEFEYSDLVYPRQISSVGVKHFWNNKQSSASLTWIRENDNLDLPLTFSLNKEEREQLKDLGDGDVKIRSAVKDPKGHYVKESRFENSHDSIFVYIQEKDKQDGVIYYRVTFFNIGPLGEYARHVTVNGELYFEYVDEVSRDNYSDLYVPWRIVPSPDSHQIFNMTTDLSLGDSTQAIFEVAGSIRDQNILSDINDKDNLGYAGKVELSHRRILPGNMGHLFVTASSRELGKQFSTLQRDKIVEFEREWNLSEKDMAVSQRLSEIEIHHRIGKRNQTTFSLGTYGDIFQHSRRWQGTTSLSFNWIPSLNIDITEVSRGNKSPQMENTEINSLEGESSWKRARFSARFLPGKFHPYIRYLGEERTSEFRFYETGGGFTVENNQIQTNIGLLRRLDYDSQSPDISWQELSESWLGEMDFRGRWRSGYRANLLFKHKIKSYSDQKENFNYNLARGSLGYFPKRGIIRASVDFKFEQTLFQHKIIVYDSVGSGLGQYRYDSNYNQYFSDPNGSFVAIHVPSGKKIPASHITTGFKLSYNFRKTPYPLLRDISWRLSGNTDYNGSNPVLSNLLSPSFTEQGINRSRINLQQDLNYLSRTRHRRIRISTLHRHEVLGRILDDASERQSQKYTTSLEEAIVPSVILVTDASLEKSENRSVRVFRSRKTRGWFLNPGLRWKLSKLFETGSDLHFGYSEGDNSYESFEIQLSGMGVHIQLFPRKGGRLQGSIDYYHVIPKNPLKVTLPPEAAQGLQAGKTYRARLTAFLVFGNNMSANANIAYLLDPIYDGIFTITGEFRATF